MSIQALSPEFAVTGQITPQDVTELAKAGFKSIICNRPDGEGGPVQPTFREIELVALIAGMQARYLPVVAGQITPVQGMTMANLLATLPGPVLAYCRTGARSTSLWELARHQSPSD